MPLDFSTLQGVWGDILGWKARKSRRPVLSAKGVFKSSKTDYFQWTNYLKNYSALSA